MSKSDDIIKGLHPKKKKAKRTPGLSTGSTLLNLGLTGNPNEGFLPGHYYFFVGDSESGKTFLTMTCFAEAAINAAFDDYELVRDDPEDGMLMDVPRLFGPPVAKRMRPLGGTVVSPKHSETVEEFYFRLDDLLKQGPVITVLDSMDALVPEDDESKFEELKAAYEKGRDASGTYGTAKAKANSTGLRRVIPKLKQTGSILIIVSQTRDRIGFGSTFEPKTRSGGRALKFYATAELWTSVKGQVKTRVKGKERQQGIISHIIVKKNRHTGQHHTVDVPILHRYGIDDISSCITYLVEEKHWKKEKGGVVATDLDVCLPEEDLARYIDDNDLQRDLRLIVSSVWEEIEQACKIQRKARYGT